MNGRPAVSIHSCPSGVRLSFEIYRVGMIEQDHVTVRQLNPATLNALFVIELPRGAPLPPLRSRQLFDGEAFVVVGYLHFGDGHGPVLLAERVGQTPDL